MLEQIKCKNLTDFNLQFLIGRTRLLTAKLERLRNLFHDFWKKGFLVIKSLELHQNCVLFLNITNKKDIELLIIVLIDLPAFIWMKRRSEIRRLHLHWWWSAVAFWKWRVKLQSLTIQWWPSRFSDKPWRPTLTQSGAQCHVCSHVLTQPSELSDD